MFETTSLYNSIFVLQKNSFCRAFSIIILELLLLKQYQRSIIAYLLHNLVCDQISTYLSRLFSKVLDKYVPNDNKKTTLN